MAPARCEKALLPKAPPLAENWKGKSTWQRENRGPSLCLELYELAAPEKPPFDLEL